MSHQITALPQTDSDSKEIRAVTHTADVTKILLDTQARLDVGGVEVSDSTPVPIKLLNTAVPAVWDYVSVTYPTSSSEIYVFKTGGSGGTTQATITVSYVDSTKADLLTVVRT